MSPFFDCNFVDGGDVHDRTTAGAPHGLDRRADAEEGADLVHVDHALVVGRLVCVIAAACSIAALFTRTFSGPMASAAAIAASHSPSWLTSRRWKRAASPSCAASARPRLLEHVRDQHTRALAHEDAHRGGAHAARTAGDQCHLARQPAHVVDGTVAAARIRPIATMALATLMKPAILAPFT